MTSTPDHEAVLDQQGHYAGAVTRLVAFLVDQTVLGAVYALAAAGLTFVVDLVTGYEMNLSDIPIVSAVALWVWAFCYYAYCWAANGQTIGMALLGVRVVRSDGSPTGPRQAVLRTLSLPLAFLSLGIGFLGILWRSDRRAWHDRIGGTAVVYSWDARAAQLRFLARR